MADIIRLPARPNLDHYKKLAKDLHDACRTATPDAIRDWAAAWMRRRDDAQEDDVDRVVRTWNNLVKARPALQHCSLTDAQFVIARIHGFETWPAFAAHIETLAREHSGTAIFESAVDAIVGGDLATLERLLREHPDLVRQRSAREHRATLLHYVSANGVEDFRQKTPPNIVDIARLLLDAGADVNAESNSYSPRDTTFTLTATSCHPADAGVQIPLLELLLARGAAVDWPPESSTVIACLHNGRGLAADYCAAHGSRLDLEGAAGVGRLDVMREYMRPDGTLRNGATPRQVADGFAWACQFGKTEAVRYMLDAGFAVNRHIAHHGNTGLHWAAYGGHPETVKLLLDRGAAVNDVDETHTSTPIEWAIYAWGNRTLSRDEEERFYVVVETLARAGATVGPQWLTSQDPERGRATRRLQSDARMRAALDGRRG